MLREFMISPLAPGDKCLDTGTAVWKRTDIGLQVLVNMPPIGRLGCSSKTRGMHIHPVYGTPNILKVVSTNSAAERCTPRLIFRHFWDPSAALLRVFCHNAGCKGCYGSRGSCSWFLGRVERDVVKDSGNICTRSCESRRYATKA